MSQKDNVLISNLYQDKHLSVKEIADQLGYSEYKIRHVLSTQNTPIRTRSQANYYKYNPHGDPFSIKNHPTPSELNLKYLALGLYWGEGCKTNYQCIRLINSDPMLIKQFYLFLINFCQISPGKIRYYLQTFKDNDICSAKIFWSSILAIEPTRINTSKPTPSQGKGNYKKICKNGVMAIAVYNTHFHTWVMEELKKLGYNPD